MLHTEIPQPVKFICGFIYKDEATFKKVRKILAKKYSAIDFESEKIDFTFTDYYNSEMGTPLFRKFISFRRLQKPESLINIKLFCVKLENKFAPGKKRTINIDPGYLTEAKLVLTTTKDFSHRIYLNKGVFAEVTLSYCKAGFKHYSNTFPDYRTDLYKNIFSQIRSIYHRNLKK